MQCGRPGKHDLAFVLKEAKTQQKLLETQKLRKPAQNISFVSSVIETRYSSPASWKEDSFPFFVHKLRPHHKYALWRRELVREREKNMSPHFVPRNKEKSCLNRDNGTKMEVKPRSMPGLPGCSTVQQEGLQKTDLLVLQEETGGYSENTHILLLCSLR